MNKITPDEEQLCGSLLEELREEVQQKVELTGDFSEICYLGLVTEALEAAGVLEESFVCHYSQEYKRLNVIVSGYAYEEERDCLTLFACILNEDEGLARVDSHALSKAAQKAANLLVAIDRGLDIQLSFSNREIEMVERIKQVREQVGSLRVIVFTDGLASVTDLSDIVVQQTKVHVEVWDILRLARLRMSDRPRDPITVDCEKDLSAPLAILEPPWNADDCKVVLAIIPGEALARLYERYGQRLLEYNVRSFLQVTAGVNKGIRDTLRSEPQRFLAYNNGISATADRLELGTLASGQKVIRNITGLQIVNGGQTTASIHRAWKQDKVDLSQVYVQCKITLVDMGNLAEMVGRISKYANTQNIIQMADFSANEPYHIGLERLSEQIWCPDQKTKWFYERARGQFAVAKNAATTAAQKKAFVRKVPPSHKVTKTDVAKALSCYDGYPQITSKGAQKCFVEFMARLRKGKQEDWVPDKVYYTELIGKILFFRECEAAAKRAKIGAYKAQLVYYLCAYSVAKLGNKLDIQKIWSTQKIENDTRARLDGWVAPLYEALVQSARGKNVTEWCKKDQCWQEITELSF